MNPGIVFSCNGEQAALMVIDALSRRGLQVVRSFDWHGAMHGECDCPYHGTARCTCQYIVLLVYGSGGYPAVVTAHSRDERSHIGVVIDANAPPDQDLVYGITATLRETSEAHADVSYSPGSAISGSG